MIFHKVKELHEGEFLINEPMKLNYVRTLELQVLEKVLQMLGVGVINTNIANIKVDVIVDVTSVHKLEN